MIVSAGEALVDLVPDPVPGGGPMNVAVTAARLGAPSAFVGGVSTDAHGELIWAHLEAEGVDLRAARRFDAPTARAIIEHVPQLRFRFEGVDTADTQLEHVDLAPLAPGPHLLHGGTLGLFRGPTAEALATLAESHDGLVSLDPNIRPQIIDDAAAWHHFHDRWLPHTHLYKGSDEDLSWIWPDRTPEGAAEALLAAGMAVVVLTRGSDGLSIFTGHGETRAPAPAIDVVDTVGAGDTIVGTILVSLWEAGVRTGTDLGQLDQATWHEIARRAVTSAGITCSRPGADPPRRGELDW